MEDRIGSAGRWIGPSGSGGARVLTKAQLTAMATSDRWLLVQDVEALEKGGVLCFAWAHWSKAVDPKIVDVPW